MLSLVYVCWTHHEYTNEHSYVLGSDFELNKNVFKIPDCVHKRISNLIDIKLSMMRNTLNLSCLQYLAHIPNLYQICIYADCTNHYANQKKSI